MYRKGHYGVSLVVFAPLAFVLVTLGRADLAVVTGGIMLWLTMLPDVDHRLPGGSAPRADALARLRRARRRRLRWRGCRADDGRDR